MLVLYTIQRSLLLASVLVLFFFSEFEEMPVINIVLFTLSVTLSLGGVGLLAIGDKHISQQVDAPAINEVMMVSIAGQDERNGTAQSNGKMNIEKQQTNTIETQLTNTIETHQTNPVETEQTETIVTEQTTTIDTKQI
eukprot:502878_1